jgi:hypothetical protein
MNNVPSVGSVVEIIIDRSYVNRYLDPNMKHSVAPQDKIIGKIIPLPSWMTQDSDIAIYDYKTNRNSYIPLSRILSIGGIKITQPEPTKDKMVTVISSKTGEPYNIRFDGRLNKWSCTCPGFQFKRKCRHISRMMESSQ